MRGDAFEYETTLKCVSHVEFVRLDRSAWIGKGRIRSF